MIKTGAQIAAAAIEPKDFFLIKNFAAITLEAAVSSEKNKAQTIYKINPGSACEPEKPFKPIIKKKNKMNPTAMLTSSVIKKFSICIAENYENIRA